MKTHKLFQSVIFLVLATIILPVSVFAASGVVTGTVIDSANDSPIAGAKVILTPHAYGYGTRNYMATTDTRGRFIISNIIESVYSSGGARTWIKYRAYIIPPSNFSPCAQYVSANMSFQFQFIHELVIPLSKIADSGELTGRVFNVDTNTRIANAQVTLKPSAYFYGARDYTTTTGPNGDFVIRGIRRYVYSSGPLPKPVKYSINVYVPGYPEYVSEYISFNNQSIQERQIGLTK